MKNKAKRKRSKLKDAIEDLAGEVRAFHDEIVEEYDALWEAIQEVVKRAKRKKRRRS